MSVDQATLHDFRERFEWEQIDFAKTVILVLEPPTNRKRERLDHAIEEAHAVTTEAANRMESVPRIRWGTAKPKNSTWYNWAKEVDHDLSNKTAHENIQRVRESFRSWQSKGYPGNRPSFSKADRCSFNYEQPKYERYNDRYYLSLPLAAGIGQRELIPIRDGDYIRTFIDRILDGDLSKGRGELLLKNGRYQFHQVIRRTIDVIANPVTTIGVDIGLSNLAVAGAVRGDDRVGARTWSGAEAGEMRRRYAEKKRLAQQDQLVEEIRDDEQKYIENVCHRVSRELVEFALSYDRPEIVLENLVDIRETFIRRKREHTKSERRALHSWPFRKLQDMIEYKATEAGIPVEFIQPEHTSNECCRCGEVNPENREGIHFECSSCGHELNADVNAAFVIAKRV